MHPILAERRVFFLYLSVWMIVAALLAALLHSTGMPLVEAILLSIPMCLVYSFMCLASYYLCRTFPLHRVNIARLLVIHPIAAVLTTSVWISLGKTWASFLSELGTFPEINEHFGLQIPLIVTIGITLFLLAVAVHYAIIAFRESREAERHTMELRLLAQEAELKALRAQINPHFLFNSLNSISALTSQDPQSARTMTLRLADFLRKTLALGARNAITFREELDLTRAFLAIEQVRFGSRLSLNLSTPEGTLDCTVPPLVLQPLVENAIGHGIGHLVEGGTITLEAEISGPRLRIVVRNPVDPARVSQNGQGIGLQNVRSRLRALYEDDGRLDVRRAEDQFEVEINIPSSRTSP